MLMKTNHLILFIIAVMLLATACSSSEGSGKNTDQENYVVMLSMDGFRWDYPDSIPTPNLDRIAGMGVKAKSLQPSFPTKTFPNHYAMATGLYPDHHGIVQNSFYDPALGRYYHMRDSGSRNDPVFYQGEPIWETAENQDLTAATFFWVGSDVLGADNQSTYWKPYDHDLPFAHRIDSVIAWLKLPQEKRPQLIMWYVHEPDATGHYEGPFAQQTDSVIMMLDSLVGVFMEKVADLPFSDKINVIVTSDHGMGKISPDKVVDLTKKIDTSWFEVIEGHNPNYTLKVKEGFLDTAYAVLSRIEHISVWKHGEVPEELHYGTNPRTLDLIVLADSAWSVTMGKDLHYKATHGYDNRNLDMHAIFYAYGPAFKKNYSAETFENVDLYNLIAEILHIKPAKTDGQLNRVSLMLKDNDVLR